MEGARYPPGPVRRAENTPAERLADPERNRRFVQEAKAASALDHANIVHIYDIADADGVQFIAMEYVSGKTLDQLIGRKGLRLNEALKYAVQIADALARAHAAGIVHWTADGRNIVFSSNRSGSFGLWLIPAFGRAPERLPAAGENASTVSVSRNQPPSLCARCR